MTKTRMSISALIVLTFLLGALLPMFPLAAALNDPADTHGTVHVTGDWIVEDTRTYTAHTLIYMDNGNVVVKNGGVLSLDDSSLFFFPTAHGNKGITVEKGGTLKVANTQGIASQTLPNTFHCAFLKGSIIDLKDANIWGAGGSTATTPDTGVYIGTDNVTIHNMMFRENRQNIPLMQIDGKNVTIDNSTFGNYGNRGLVVQGQAEVFDTRFIPDPGPAGTGISVQNGGDLKLVDSEIMGMNGALTVVQGKALLITNNIHNNQNNGITAIYDAKVELRGNIIETSQMDGVFAAFDSDITIQKDNFIRNNNQNGINAYAGGNFDIKGSTIRDNFDLNVGVYNSKVTIDECNILGPMTGVSVAGSRPVKIRNSTFDASMHNDPIIAGDLGSDITVEGNHFKNGNLAFYGTNEANIVAKKNDFTGISNIAMMEIHANFEGYANTYNAPLLVAFAQLRATVYSENEKYTGPAAPTTMFQVSSGAVLEVHKMVADHMDNSAFVLAQMDGKAFIYDTKANFAGTAVLFARDGVITSINSSIPLSDVTAIGKGKVNLGWHALVKTQWQDGFIAPGASVEMVDGPANQTDTFTTGDDGRYDLDIIQWTSTQDGDINHNNYDFTATLNGMDGLLTKNVSKNMDGTNTIVLTITDDAAPTLDIVAPTNDWLTSDTEFTVNGTAGDIGSGLAKVEVNTGSGWVAATGLAAWTMALDLQEGSQTIQVKATDIAGLFTNKSIDIVIDLTAPDLMVDLPAGLYVKTNEFYLNGTTEIGADVLVDGDVATNVDGQFSILLDKADGEYNITVESQDAVGNKATVHKLVIVDTVAPTLSCDITTGTWFNSNNVTVTGKSDGSSVLVSGNAATLDLKNGTWSYKINSGDGAFTLAIEARDLAGNNVTIQRTINVDTVKPTITVSAPTGTGPIYTNKASINVSGKVTDLNLLQIDMLSLTPGGTRVTFDTAGNFTHTVNLVEGTNPLMLVAMDKAGNEVKWEYTVIKDTKAPVIEITSPMTGLVTKAASAQVTGKVDDIKAALKLGTTNLTNTNGTFTTTATLTVGANTISVTATDLAGNSATASVTVTYDNEALFTRTKPTKTKLTTGSETTTITGTSEPGAKVYINDVAIPVNADGTFSYKLILKEGKNKVAMKAVDPAGNEKTDNFSVIYTDEKQYAMSMVLILGIVLMIIGLIIGVVVGRMMARPKARPPSEGYPSAPARTVPKTEETAFTPEEGPEEPEPAPPKTEPKVAPKIEPKPEPKVEPKPAPKVEPKPAPKVEPKPAAKDEGSLDDLLKNLEKK